VKAFSYLTPFFRATLCVSAVLAEVQSLSVRLLVNHIRVLYPLQRYRQTSFSVW